MPETDKMIVLDAVSKVYNRGRLNEVTALHEVSLVVPAGAMICLRGASGSGKSTLLSIIGCIIAPSSGRAIIADKPLSRLPDRFLTIHRRQYIGYIFQQFNVLPELTVLDNVTLPLLPLGVGPAERRARGNKLLAHLAIDHRASFPAGQISGGELQRVAIARALINDPPIILADEPTAHLDSKLSREFMATMAELKRAGKTIVLASHDSLVTESPELDQIINVKDGRIDVS